MRIERFILVSAALVMACGSGSGSPTGLGTSADPVGPQNPPTAPGENPGGPGDQTGQGGSGQGGSGAVSGTGGVSGSGGGGNLVCESVCLGCGATSEQCGPLCAQLQPTQDELACIQSSCDLESCIGAGGGSGGVGGGGSCLEDGSFCDVGSECCAQVCTDGYCGTPSGPQCGLAGDACSFPEDCCSFNCDGICF